MKVFITGITGTLGTALARLHHSRGDSVVGIARSESKIVQWLHDNPSVAKVYSRDVGDLVHPRGASEEADFLTHSDRCYHLAALKHVDLCERQIAEAVGQNILHTGRLAYTCQALGVPFTFVSSDKAASPEGVYGATKLIAEKEVLARGGAVVRLGNLIGSSGSVFERWATAARRGEPILLTDPLMTRLFISIEKAAGFVADCALTGQLVAPRMKGVAMGAVANALAVRIGAKATVQIVGPRPGEARHQYLFPPGSWVRVEEKYDRFIADPRGTHFPNGISSVNVRQWDAEELLCAAGVLE